MIQIVLITVVLLCVVHLVLNYSRTARMLAKIPGPPGLVVIGNSWEVILPPVELFKYGRRMAKEYHGIWRLWCSPISIVNIFSPEDIEIILSNSTFNNKGVIYNFLKPWLGDGLLISGGPKWLQRRKILTPAFHFNILRHFSEVLEENSLRLADKLEAAGDVTGTGDVTAAGDVTADVVPLLSEYTLHSICETAMGTKLDDEQKDEGRVYKEAIHKVGKFMVERFSKVYLFSDSIFNLTSTGKQFYQSVNTVHRFTKRVIKERKGFVRKNGIIMNEKVDQDKNDEEIYMYNRKNKVAMLDLLITAQTDGSIDDKGIQEEVDTFMFEGHDTTATGLVYLLMSLACDKMVQDKAVEELKEIFGDSTRPATMQDLGKMKYIDCCIKESLRLYPPVPFIARILNEEVVLSGYTVPAGTQCNIHIYDLHRRADLFENPSKFDPDRFLPKNSAGRHPYAYIPFSAGPRNCIGQKFAMLEMKSAVSSLLRKFELQPVTRPEDLEFVSDLVLRNNGPVLVSFKKRTVQ